MKSPVIVQDASLGASLGVTPATEDDVFVSAPPTGPLVLAAAPNAIEQRIVHNLRPPVGPRGLQPRPDRVSQLPSARNAQGMFPPEALIFVAKYVRKNAWKRARLTVLQPFQPPYR